MNQACYIYLVLLFSPAESDFGGSGAVLRFARQKLRRRPTETSGYGKTPRSFFEYLVLIYRGVDVAGYSKVLGSVAIVSAQVLTEVRPQSQSRNSMR